ncbi:hypothetical protein ASPWEDRAFT_172914 [Aspergillus wentii DTO 134E9]|uniref:Heterokaryon incompatibility domain-containing protein n=1 Tax=Aspergillus wentii DTO 134E9 TaxID=1073089 RepID=A0A1L9RMR8_ASPWE|nr:uncharacterized protein ASPWEDRAFT_172914 [Aspergillus wentii DTO 134E9]KAI9929429.1 hypothetical protein MW887_000899 [Aspergillus wentii]OJJ36127.1 hypothetical protein ASPWEDRAFT_172914 [Aspergillus wentii DTO 134E9]
MERRYSYISQRTVSSFRSARPIPDNSCALCECMGKMDDHNQVEIDRTKLFHEECTRCSSYMEEPLCQLCKHMRLGHIFRCERYKELGKPKYGAFTFTIKLGSLGELQQRSENCHVCSTFVQTVAWDSHLDSRNAVELCLYIWFGSRKARVSFHLAVFTDKYEAEFVNAGGSTTPNRYYFDFPTKGLFDYLPCTRKPRDMVNWDKAISHLDRCYRKHDNPVKPFQQPPGFRVIDTEKGCITDAPPDCTYATLSYTWQKTEETDLQATTDNIHELEQNEFLFNHPVPATIDDAIIACKKLKIPYLWVDRLCILQDASDQDQIDAMGDIYHHSVVTLVAAAGSDIHHGLPGVSSPRTLIQCKTQGIHFVQGRVPYINLARSSKLATGGWTFRETLLSPRVLLFTDSATFFECCHEA